MFLHSEYEERLNRSRGSGGGSGGIGGRGRGRGRGVDASPTSPYSGMAMVGQRRRSVSVDEGSSPFQRSPSTRLSVPSSPSSPYQSVGGGIGGGSGGHRRSISSSSFASPPISPVKQPGRRRERYSDRFIPSRAASNLETTYSLLEKSSPIGPNSGSNTSSTTSISTTNTISNSATPTTITTTTVTGSRIDRSPNTNVGQSSKDDNQATYSLLLRTQILGHDPELSPSPTYGTGDNSREGSGSGSGNGAANDSPGGSSGVNSGRSNPAGLRRNLFRYMSPDQSSSAHSPYSLSPMGMKGQKLLATRKTPRKISKTPFKVLEAPSIQDDFYLNLVDWSSQNVLAVGLKNCVYLWNASTSHVHKLCELEDATRVASVSWIQRGTHLAVGTNHGGIHLWDVARGKRIRSMGGHKKRVGTLAWNANILSSGSRDHAIYHRDVRVKDDWTARLKGHTQEVCGLKWSFDGKQLASGGNDNKLLVWDVGYTTPVVRFLGHTAAVKAIAWSPHQRGLLASGGGTADRSMRFWSTASGQALNCIDTGSQVCNLTWSKNVDELVSTHGYSQNQVIIWSYPHLTPLCTLTGHSMRVLYLAVSPDGQTVVTGAGDETLRFWNVFPSARASARANSNSQFLHRTDIR
eukprot:TRINITY_DN5427_c0_g1_i1.p1 TRINITY_DN5427_c0_g1~~TRINITY_DN5427_c0_g1_i1.p1  ORF type:complete len:634 (+),score=104.79 TRINITY_DN5427_c0_g1_i1:209-2110(+)